MSRSPAPTPPSTACEHREREDGVCTACGHCLHDIILNRACYFCGSTDIDAVAISPKPAQALVPAHALIRNQPRPAPEHASSAPGDANASNDAGAPENDPAPRS